jgi:hypothetical protein
VSVSNVTCPAPTVAPLLLCKGMVLHIKHELPYFTRNIIFRNLFPLYFQKTILNVAQYPCSDGLHVGITHSRELWSTKITQAVVAWCSPTTDGHVDTRTRWYHKPFNIKSRKKRSFELKSLFDLKLLVINRSIILV